MPANDFEKQVQKQLDELQLNPSASVWKKVEEQIREKKRRRVIVLFLLPIIVMILGVSYYLFLYSGKEKSLVRQPATPIKQSQSTTANINSVQKNQQANSEQTEHTTAKRQDEINNTTTTTPSPGQQELVKTDNEGSADYSITNASIGKQRKNNTVKNVGKQTRSNKQTNNSFELATQTPSKQKNIADNKGVIATDAKGIGEKNEPVKDLLAKDAQDSDLPAEKKAITEKNDSVAITATNPATKEETLPKKKMGKSPIKWGIDVSAGVSSTQGGVFSLEKSYVADMSTGIPPLTSGGGGPVAAIPPSETMAGPAFRIGLVAEMQVSKKSSFSAGLQYAYASNKIKTGVKKDTAITLSPNYASNGLTGTRVNQIYRGAQQNDYTNKYHFISLPIWYHLQLNKGKKLPVQWDLGIAASYMISSNALVYSEGYGGIYYHDKEVFNKMHFNLGTGLSFRLKSKNNSEWVIGPELSFDMSSLIKNDKQQYLFYGGVSTKFFFPKKK